MANKFIGQISILQGTVNRAKANIAEREELIAQNNAANERMWNSIQDQQNMIETSQKAIDILEGIGSEEDSKSV